MRMVTLAITGLMLAGFWWQTRNYPSASSAAPFHARAKATIESIPDQLGNWKTLERPEAPPAAQQLLRPNAITARVLENTATGERAQLVIVQTADARDMAGHWPPNCYPAHGWRKGYEGAVVEPRNFAQPAELAGALRASVYPFFQLRFPNDRRIRIYCFFVMPGKGVIADLASVRAVAEDYRVRPYGAAQVQVILDGAMAAERADAIFEELVGAIAPQLRALAERE